VKRHQFRRLEKHENGGGCNQVMENAVCRTCSTNWNRRKAYRLLVGRPDEKIPVRKSRFGWRIILKLIINKYNGVVWDWINLA
jgi:hypothetical protein